MNTKRNELHEGIGGNGAQIWMVVTVVSESWGDRWVWQERFKTRAEAVAWLRAMTY
jgi:hypothetical protein